MVAVLTGVLAEFDPDDGPRCENCGIGTICMNPDQDLWSCIRCGEFYDGSGVVLSVPRGVDLGEFLREPLRYLGSAAPVPEEEEPNGHDNPPKPPKPGAMVEELGGPSAGHGFVFDE